MSGGLSPRPMGQMPLPPLPDEATSPSTLRRQNAPVFLVKVENTPDAAKLGLIGQAELSLQHGALVLRTSANDIFQWHIGTLRSYEGRKRADVFSFTSGRRSATGVGNYRFHTPQASEIHDHVHKLACAVAAGDSHDSPSPATPPTSTAEPPIKVTPSRLAPGYVIPNATDLAPGAPGYSEIGEALDTKLHLKPANDLDDLAHVAKHHGYECKPSQAASNEYAEVSVRGTETLQKTATPNDLEGLFNSAASRGYSMIPAPRSNSGYAEPELRASREPLEPAYADVWPLSSISESQGENPRRVASHDLYDRPAFVPSK